MNIIEILMEIPKGNIGGNNYKNMEMLGKILNKWLPPRYIYTILYLKHYTLTKFYSLTKYT